MRHDNSFLMSGLPITLLHGTGASSGFGDEIVFVALLGGLLFALIYASRRGRRKAKRKKK